MAIAFCNGTIATARDVPGMPPRDDAPPPATPRSVVVWSVALTRSVTFHVKRSARCISALPHVAGGSRVCRGSGEFARAQRCCGAHAPRATAPAAVRAVHTYRQCGAWPVVLRPPPCGRRTSSTPNGSPWTVRSAGEAWRFGIILPRGRRTGGRDRPQAVVTRDRPGDPPGRRRSWQCSVEQRGSRSLCAGGTSGNLAVAAAQPKRPGTHHRS